MSLQTAGVSVNKKSMDWQIGPLSRKSSLDERPFEPGDRAVTFLFLAPGGQLERYDIHEEALSPAVSLPEGQELGRWTRTIKPPEEKGVNLRQRLENSEALFLSLFGERMEEDENGEMVYLSAEAVAALGGEDTQPEAVPEPAPEPVAANPPEAGDAAQADSPEAAADPAEPADRRAVVDTLKHLLALMLERKRILKPVGRRRLEGVQPYLHAKTKREYEVPVLPLDEGVVQRIEQSLEDLIF